MATDKQALTDETRPELNPSGPDPDNGPQPEPIPSRPSSTDNRAAWVKYTVALGLHPDDAAELTVVELSAMAARLGGG